MPRLPQPGSDTGTWGSILNEFLLQSHGGDGTLKDDSVGSAQLQDDSVTAAALAPGSVTKADVGLGNVDDTSDANKPVSMATQTALNTKLTASSNLSDLASAVTARTNLGLSSVATQTPVQLAAENAFAKVYNRRDFPWGRDVLLQPGRGFLPLSEDPPTVSVSAHNGATAVSNPVTINLATAQTKVHIEGTPNPSLISSTYVANVLYDEFQPFALHYITDATYHEVSYQASATPSFRIWVDGRRATADLANLTSGGGGTYRLRITFPDRRFREIRIDTVSFFPSVITASATDTVYAPPRPPVVAAFVGDSFTQQYSPDNWAGTCARLLGWEPIFNGSGGTGYIATSGSHLAFSSRMAAYIYPAQPEVVVIAGGINDGLTNLQTTATALFADIRANLPYVLIVAIGPWAPSSGSASSQASKGAAIQAAVAADTNAIYIDNLTDPWITGSGRVGATASDGNADLYISADGTHPTQDGNIYLGTRAAAAIHAALASR